MMVPSVYPPKPFDPKEVYAVAIDLLGAHVLLNTGEIVEIDDFVDDDGEPVEEIDDATFVQYWIGQEWRCRSDLETLPEFTIN